MKSYSQYEFICEGYMLLILIVFFFISWKFFLPNKNVTPLKNFICKSIYFIQNRMSLCSRYLYKTDSQEQRRLSQVETS